MIDKYLIGGAVGLAMLVVARFSGRADGVKDTNALWEKRKTAYEELARKTAETEFNAREKIHDKIIEKTNTITKESKVYYETNPAAVCLDEPRSLFIGDARRKITASSGSEVAGESDGPSRRPETEVKQP